MELFKGQSLLEFTERFKTDLDCEEYLASLKWEDGYCCRKCGHKKYQVRKDFSRTCNICGDTESPTAGTLFHRLKFGLRKAFFICFEMTTTTKGLSASQVARRYEISRQTAHYFMQKVREAMKSSESHKMNDRVQVDGFTIGGKEEGKNFPTLHKVIHQVKSWIRGIYSWVSEFNIDRYLAEYSFRINRSQNKDTIFNKLMKRIVERSPVSQSQLVCS